MSKAAYMSWASIQRLRSYMAQMPRGVVVEPASARSLIDLSNIYISGCLVRRSLIASDHFQRKQRRIYTIVKYGRL